MTSTDLLPGHFSSILFIITSYLFFQYWVFGFFFKFFLWPLVCNSGSDLITSDTRQYKKTKRSFSEWLSFIFTVGNSSLTSSVWLHFFFLWSGLICSLRIQYSPVDLLKCFGSTYFTHKSGVENKNAKVWKSEDKQSKNLRYTSYSGGERRQTHTHRAPRCRLTSYLAL